MVSKILIVVCILLIALIGCQTLVDSITPSFIPERALDYAEVDLSEKLIPSLNDARIVRDEIIIGHRDVQLDLKRIAEDDVFAYQDALNYIDGSIAAAEALQDLVIGSPENPYSLLGLLAPLGLGTMVGLKFKRKGDFSPEEMEVEKVKAKNGSA